MSGVPSLVGLCAAVAATVLLTAVAPGSWQPWVQLAAAAVIAAVVTARRRGRPLLSRDPAPRRASVDVVDLIAPDRSAVGCVEGDRIVTTAVEVSAGAFVTTVVGRDDPADHRGARIPLAAIARQLDQGGVVLEGIDVVVRGRRAAPGDDGEVYSRLVGPLSLVSHRRVHLLLRFDLARLTLHAPDGADSPVSEVVAVATERLRRALVHHGMPCQVLDAAELADYFLEAEASAETPAGDGIGLVVRPAGRPRAVVDRLTSVRAAELTEVVRLRRVEGRADVVDAVTSVGLTGTGPADPRATTGADDALAELSSAVHPLPGPGVLPVPGETMPTTVTGCLDRIPVALLDGAAPPAHGAGQILGATRDGGAAAIQLAGPHLRSVLLTARADVCRQVAFRAVAAGYRVAVVTDVPDRWRPVLRIGDESRYRIVDPASSDAGAPVDAVIWDVDGPLSEARIDALAGPGGPDVTPPTVIRVDADWELRGGRGLRAVSPPDLVLDGRIDGWISVEPRTGDAFRVTVVTGPGEEPFVRSAPLTPAGAGPSATPGHP